MFERTLQDVVKGLRAQPTSEGRTEFASQVLQECKKEMASTDGTIKASAVLKVAHLRMLGYDDRNVGDDNTSFHVIETMALQPFKQKRIGYLAAAQLLTLDSPLLLLATNSLKKELQSSEMYAVGLALGSISNFASRGLASDLLPDVVSVATTALRPYIRKRGTLGLYRLCTRYPEGLREGAYDALRSRLDDADTAVVSCAVNAVCELAKANPRNVLPLTPQLYQLLTTSGNNWLTIKVVKLYSSLLNVEPRLAKKLLDPLAHIIKTTGAKSLLFECVSTVTKALAQVLIGDGETGKIEQIVNLCALKLKEFIRDSDQNLKYLGLVGFIELTKSYPTVAQEHKDLVLLCLNDEDVTVRLRALELLAGMANKNTVSGIVSRLLEHLATAPPGKFRDAVVHTCIDACVDDDFQRVPSCEWLVAVLMDLSRLGKSAHGPLLAKHVVNVAMRVQSVRAYAANACTRLLFATDVRADIAPEILSACAFVACEYFVVPKDGGESNVNDQDGGRSVPPGEERQDRRLVEILLADESASVKESAPASSSQEPQSNKPSRRSSNLEVSPEVRCVLILNAFKLAVKANCEGLAREHSEKWLKSSSFLIRDRTKWCRAWLDTGKKEFITTEPELGPIHLQAQRKVPLPPGLDLSFRKARKEDTGTVLTSPSHSRYTSTFISFRGRQQQTYPKSSPYSTSSSGDNQSKGSNSVLGSANTYLPFKLSSPDPSPFLLGKSKKQSSRKNKKAADSSSEEESQVDHDEEGIETKNGMPKELLWSAGITTASSASSHVGQSEVIVMAPTALPPGALWNVDEDQSLPNKPKKQGEPLTLADIDVLDESPMVFKRADGTGDSSSHNHAPNDSIKKDKKKKKIKDQDEKKQKSKKSKSKSTDDQTHSTEALAAPVLNTATEGDLLDFSEF